MPDLGVDMMDCVLPTRAGAARFVVHIGRSSLDQAEAIRCEIRSRSTQNAAAGYASGYSRAYLRHLYAANEVLAQVLNTIHNLSFYLDTMRAVRHSIALGNKAQFFPDGALSSEAMTCCPRFMPEVKHLRPEKTRNSAVNCTGARQRHPEA